MAMPVLTRRRSTDAREECWHIYYGDIQAGTIAIRSGNPHDEDPWGWHCGFYPGSAWAAAPLSRGGFFILTAAVHSWRS
jgi:hypothetical protein